TSSVHVLDNNGRITGNVLSHLARDRPRIEIVATTWGEADNQADRLTLIKGLLGAGGNCPCREATQTNSCQQVHPSSCTHIVPVYFPCSFCIRSMTSGGWTMTSLMRGSISWPLVGLISNCLFLASAKNAGSFIVFM